MHLLLVMVRLRAPGQQIFRTPGEDAGPPARERSMKIDRQEVIHVAELARLSFGEEELTMLVRQLNTILDYFDKLRDCDTSAIPPTSHVVATETPFRNDAVAGFADNDLLLQNAPSQERRCIKVPRIIES